MKQRSVACSVVVTALALWVPGCIDKPGAADDTATADADPAVDDESVLEQIDARRVNSIRFADRFPGATAGEKIAAALADLPATGGTVDARGFTGEQEISVPLLVGAPWSKPTTLLLGPALFTVSAPIQLFMNSSIIGAPTGMTVGGIDRTNTMLLAADNAQLAAILQLGDGGDGHATFAVLQDLVVDGNRSKAGTAAGGGNIVVNRSGRIDVTRVTTQNGAGHGMAMLSDPGVWQSCCAKIAKLMALTNAGAGLYLDHTNDTFVVQSEFEGNDNGIELNGTGALRATNCDMSGYGNGIYAYNGAGALTIVGNQFANMKHDIAIDGPGSGNIISGNMFLGQRKSADDAFDVIHISSSQDNAITGNIVATTNAWSGIHIYSSTGKDSVTGNVVQGASGSGGGINVPGATSLAGNVTYGQ